MRDQMRFCGSLALTLTSTVAIAWGHQGHEYMGAIADHLLGAHASKQATSILGVELRVAATWPDCAKDVMQMQNGTFKYKPDPKYHATCQVFETPEGIARMEDYVSRNTNNCKRDPKSDVCHKQYHYADVAVQHDRYDRSYAGTSDHDIVSAINAAIAVLQGKAAPAPFSIKDKKEALFLLAHFAGDVHQPLHVGAVYLDSHDHAINPDVGNAKPDPATETRGGNSIDDGSTNLHAEWDQVAKGLNPLKITDQTIKRAKAVQKSAGSTASWPAAWASDTVLVSHTAFQHVSFSHPGVKPGHWKANFDDRATYLKAKAAIQRQQLEKAGARLAELLNAVWPDQ